MIQKPTKELSKPLSTLEWGGGRGREGGGKRGGGEGIYGSSEYELLCRGEGEGREKGRRGMRGEEGGGEGIRGSSQYGPRREVSVQLRTFLLY